MRQITDAENILLPFQRWDSILVQSGIRSAWVYSKITMHRLIVHS